MESLFQNFTIYLENVSPAAYLVSFMGGIGASLTPCIYPIIPILVGVIGASSAKNQTRGFLLSVVFVLGMAATYSVIGILAAVSGKVFGLQAQNPWVLFAVGNFNLFFGLAMLGFFEFRLPGSWGRATGGPPKNLLAVFLMGAGSGSIAAPCTVPVLGALLTFVATEKNVVFGFSLLFVFALGLGVLLVAVGTFTGLAASLPKSGNWLLRIKQFFGLLMILLAEYFFLQAGKYGLF